MAEKKTAKSGNIEREYTIPLRSKFKHVARYKKTPKAIKEIKMHLAKHMKIYDRDLDKIRLSKFVNEYIWARGIKNPPHKIKVKATKQGEIVRVELVDMPDKLKYKKLREEKIETDAKAKIESKKSMMQKAKETMQSKGEEKKPDEKEKKDDDKDKNKDGVDDKKEEKEKREAGREAGKAMEKEMAKKAKHTTKIKTGAQKKVEIKQPSK